jgi:two-component system invasion response regulator UvrY
MEPVNGIEATREIRSFNKDVKIIGISVHTDLPYINALIQAGANGYVTKNSSGAEMIEAIFEVLEGRIFYCKEILALQNKVN